MVSSIINHHFWATPMTMETLNYHHLTTYEKSHGNPIESLLNHHFFMVKTPILWFSNGFPMVWGIPFKRLKVPSQVKWAYPMGIIPCVDPTCWSLEASTPPRKEGTSQQKKSGTSQRTKKWRYCNMYIYICMYVYIHVYIYIYTYKYIYIYTYIHTYICIYIYIYIYTYICICIYMYIYVYMYMCITYTLHMYITCINIGWV